MKKLFSLILCLFAIVGLSSCQDGPKKLATPTNFTISNDVASWDAVENASKYRLNIVDESAKELKRVVNNATSAEMSSFDLAVGKYNVYIQAVAEKDSGFEDSDYTTEAVAYEVKEAEIEVLNNISGSDLIENDYVKWQGRTSFNSTLGVNMIYHSASSFEVKFIGSKVEFELYATKYNDSSHRPYIVVMIDDNYETRVRTVVNKQYVTFDTASLGFTGLDDGQAHTLTVYKSTESIDSHIGLKSVTTDGTFVPGVEYKERHIEFIAASSSTGHGNMGSPTVSKLSENSDCMQAFSYLTARALDAEISIYSASGWGVKFSKWTSPNTLNLFDAYKNVDFFSNETWNVSNIIPDVIVINLGTNDWSYINDAKDAAEKDARMEAFKSQYVDFLNYLHNAYPDCKIIIFYGLMNEGQAIYDATVEIYERALPTIPGLAKIQVSGDGKGAAGHPSLSSHSDVAQLLIQKIKDEMGW